MTHPLEAALRRLVTRNSREGPRTQRQPPTTPGVRTCNRPERMWCAYCAAPSESWDHVIPKSERLGKGRSVPAEETDYENTVPCCHRCNNDKGSLKLIVFLALSA